MIKVAFMVEVEAAVVLASCRTQTLGACDRLSHPAAAHARNLTTVPYLLASRALVGSGRSRNRLQKRPAAKSSAFRWDHLRKVMATSCACRNRSQKMVLPQAARREAWVMPKRTSQKWPCWCGLGCRRLRKMHALRQPLGTPCHRHRRMVRRPLPTGGYLQWASLRFLHRRRQTHRPRRT